MRMFSYSIHTRKYTIQSFFCITLSRGFYRNFPKKFPASTRSGDADAAGCVSFSVDTFLDSSLTMVYPSWIFFCNLLILCSTRKDFLLIIFSRISTYQIIICKLIVSSWLTVDSKSPITWENWIFGFHVEFLSTVFSLDEES